MEVRHHSHSDRKRFKHYLWEFLMLFLAVFCGFLAENFREHQVEHQREKQYMTTLIEDLKADTSLLNETVKNWRDVNKSIDSVTDAITLPLREADMSKVYRHLNEAFNIWSFSYNDRTIAQLKNSGGFRLIRREAVANKIIAYDQFNNDAISKIYLFHSRFYENAMAIRSKTFAEDVITEIFKRYENTPAPYSANPWVDTLIRKSIIPLTAEEQAKQIFEFKNSLIAMRRDYVSNMAWGYSQIRKYINELLQLIKENYHLE